MKILLDGKRSSIIAEFKGKSKECFVLFTAVSYLGQGHWFVEDCVASDF